jgi:hypothetical protein
LKLVAKFAPFTIRASSLLNHIHRPKHYLDNQGRKSFTFRWSSRFPNKGRKWPFIVTQEFHIVRRFGGIAPAIIELPRHGIQGVGVQLHRLKHLPKGCKLGDVLEHVRPSSVLILEIQKLSSKVLLTEHLFRLEILKMRGAMS